MDMTKTEFRLFDTRIRELDIEPQYIPTEEEVKAMELELDKYLPYLYWLYVRYPRTGDSKEIEGLERIRPLLKQIHVHGKRKNDEK